MAKKRDIIDIVRFKPIDIEAPNVIVGLPDVGLVGAIAVSYVIDTMNMEELGYIDLQKFPPLVIIKESMIKYPIRIYGKDNVLAIISDLPFPQSIVNPFFKGLVTWVKSLNPSTVIGITGLPVHDRMQINKPNVSGIGTTIEAREQLDQAGVSLLSDGIFSGVYAGLIKECNKHNISNITLFAESYLSFPDPAASLEALSIVNKILGINIDLRQLEKDTLESPTVYEFLYDAEKKELVPLTQINETYDEIIIKLDLPCIRKEDIDLRCTDDILTVKAPIIEGCRLTPFHSKELEFKRYRKCIRLPVPVDPENTKATFKNGVLEIRLLKNYHNGVKV